MSEYKDIIQLIGHNFDLLPVREQEKMIADLQIRIKGSSLAFIRSAKGIKMCPYDERCKLSEKVDASREPPISYEQCEYHGWRIFPSIKFEGTSEE